MPHKREAIESTTEFNNENDFSFKNSQRNGKKKRYHIQQLEALTDQLKLQGNYVSERTNLRKNTSILVLIVSLIPLETI